MAAAKALGWGASISILGAAVQFVWLRWRKSRSRRRFDGLDGVVSFSSRLIAAARAVESMRPDALFIDPFAKLLAGPKALARHMKADEADKSIDLKTGALRAPCPEPPRSQPTHPAPTAGNTQQQQQQQTQTQALQPATQLQQEPGKQQQQQQQQDPSDSQGQGLAEALLYPGRQVSRLVLRTVFFDEATLLVTGQPAPRSVKALAAVAHHIQQHRLSKCGQVVMLGAGMDTRPWRLPLNRGLSWFELDRLDVLTAKQAALRAAGACFQRCGADGAADGTKGSSSDASGAVSAAGAQYPLRVGRWACASADLQQPCWIDKLREAGLTADTPIVWSAEGLLYYLDPDTVAPMLKEAAAMSPAGSMIITNFMTAEGLSHLKVSPLTAQLTKGGPAAATHTGNAAAAPDSTAPATHATSAGSNVPTAAVQDSSSGTAQSAVNTLDSSSSGSSAAAAAAPAAASGTDCAHGVDATTVPGTSRPPLSDFQKTPLLKHLKWGCPDNVEEFFADCGWQLLVRYSLNTCAEAYGWTMLHTAASRVRPNSHEVQFVVGVVIK